MLRSVLWSVLWSALRSRPSEPSMENPTEYPRPMQIFLRNPRGQTKVLKVRPDDTVEVLRRLIEAKIGIPPDHQTLTLNGKMLGVATGNYFAYDDTQTLES